MRLTKAEFRIQELESRESATRDGKKAHVELTGETTCQSVVVAQNSGMPAAKAKRRSVKSPRITIVPANEASWEDLDLVLGAARCHGAHCYCQRFKIRDSQWRSVNDEERADRLREQTACGQPKAHVTSGLIAYLNGEPAGWCAVEPRTAYVRLLYTRVPWADRAEDKTDDGVWAVTCFITRTGFRRRGVSRALARAAVHFARRRGARALEGYPMITQPGQEVTWGELHVGSRSIFAAAGFAEVSRPTLRRVVMRIDF
jgi:GNAT superfamily N-acetyltransferase